MDKMSLPLAYVMKKKKAHMCEGGDCAHPSHMAEGGKAYSGKNRSDFEKGIHPHDRGPNARTETSSYAGNQVGWSNRDNDPKEMENAKKEHRRVLSEMQSMKKPNLYAEGGEAKVKGHGRLGVEFDPSLPPREGYPKSAKEQQERLDAEQERMSEMQRRKPEKMANGGYIGSYQSSNSDPGIDGDLEPMAHLELEKRNEFMSHPDSHQSHMDHDVMNQMGDEDEGAGDMDMIHPMVRRIMMGRMQGYSKGGMVANEDQGESASSPDEMAKDKENEFDDLALRDGLEFNSTGANAGDSLDDEREDGDRADIISRIMRSRAKKDRMPRPA